MIQDGLETLRRELSLEQISTLIERTARWVDVQTFSYLPVWYPEDARRQLMYKANWTQPLYNTNQTTGERVHKRTGNSTANHALSRALGLNPKNRPNWTCCHIWGVDDPSFQKANTIVGDRRFYSCVGNMVLLPTPLKAFTDTMPEIKAMMRVAANYYYGWEPTHPDIDDVELERSRFEPSAYPQSWPVKPGQSPPGVVAFDEAVKRFADRRIAKIRDDVKTAGEFYPRDEVLAVLKYWGREDLIPG